VGLALYCKSGEVVGSHFGLVDEKLKFTCNYESFYPAATSLELNTYHFREITVLYVQIADDNWVVNCEQNFENIVLISV
jgi:hypothetical protein